MIRVLTYIFVFLIGAEAMAQDSTGVVHELVIFGNTSSSKMGKKELKQIDKYLKEEKGHYTSFHLGDIAHQDGLTHKRKKKVKKRVEQLLELSHKKKGKLYFIPGDHDWNNSGKKGISTVKELEKFIEKELKYKNAFLPSDGCPGPIVMDIKEDLRIIAINTQWFIHPFKKSAVTNTSCANLTVAEFFEDLEGQIEEAEGRQVVILGHHPILSFGEYGGRIPLKKHIFPLSDKNPENRVPLPGLGSIYAAYRQNVGSPRDMAYPKYQEFIEHMTHTLGKFQNLIYASGHEHSLQLNDLDGNYQLISGSLNAPGKVYGDSKSIFGSKQKGFSKIILLANGDVDVAFYGFSKDTVTELYRETLFKRLDEEEVFEAGVSTEGALDSAKAIGGDNYVMGGIFRPLFGSLYRDAWATEVKVPMLNLDTAFGGLRAIEKGGGLQTHSLKLKAKNKQEYVFRSVNKDPSKAFEKDLNETLIMDFIQDMIATQHPFGAVPVAYMLDHTSIIHASPRLYVMPKTHPRLGEFQQDFGGVFGLLEPKPKSPKKKREGYAGADAITKSTSLFRALYDNPNTQVDTKEYAKARMFDMFINDWDRHEDNIKWAGFKDGKKWIYRPLPRDRDHSFSKMDGFIYWLMDREWAVSFREGFDDNFGGLKNLNQKAQFLDRALLSELTQEDWEAAAAYIHDNITEEIIDEAFKLLPEQLQDEATLAIPTKLKARRKLLKEAAVEHYKHLAKEVDVIGTNERETFKIKRLENGDVEVKMFHQKRKGKKGKKLFERTFIHGETNEIRIYGLGSDDDFKISGEVDKSILVRIIGGYGEDRVKDESSVKGWKKYTQVFDHHKKTVKSDTGEVKFERLDDEDTYLYGRKNYKGDTYFPIVYMGYNTDDKLFISGGVTFTNHGFMEDGFLSRHQISSTVTFRQAFIGSYDAIWRKRRKRKIDYGLSLDAATRYPLYDFYGLGNEIEKSDDLRLADFYNIQYRGFKTKSFLQHRFFYRSNIRFGISTEGFTTVAKEGTILDQSVNNQLKGNNTFLIGGFTSFDIDLRDKRTFPQRGMRFTGNYELLSRKGEFINTFKASWEHYSTIHILTPITLGLKLGGETTDEGDLLPFYKLPRLGLDNGLRGYRKNSFIGTSSFYFNTDLRLHLGKLKTIIAPMHYGLLGLFDTGKVWYEGTESRTWHKGYGGGVYIAPVSKDYAFKLLFTTSEEEQMMVLFNLGLAL